MNITKKVLLELSPEEAQKLFQIMVDEDKEAALLFVKECLGKKLEEKIRPHCVPVFEASYAPKKRDWGGI